MKLGRNYFKSLHDAVKQMVPDYEYDVDPKHNEGNLVPKVDKAVAGKKGKGLKKGSEGKG